MIACNYCGRENDDASINCHECGTALPPKPVQETLPELPDPKIIQSEALETAFSYEGGFHRADWDFIGRWIESNVPPLDVEEAWNEVALLWITKLRDDLGGNYFVLQSRQTILLCDQPLKTARWLLDYAGRAAITIRENLGGTAWSGSIGRNVALVLSDLDDYYQYVAYYSPEGEQATSSGMCINSGYTHVVLPWHDDVEAANTIVHELTHSCLAHLPLPPWLNEGVAVTLQKAIAPPVRSIVQGEQSAVYAAMSDWRAPIMWDELAERHFAFWNDENIQSFWAGTSFYEPGDPNELSYSLGEVLVKLLSERGDTTAFHAFLQAAHSDDAGQTAALDILGADLGEIAGTFLGEGNWRPQRKAMIACWDATGWRKRGESNDVPPSEDTKDTSN